jgi:putative nucleotidyltransferase with HDIG domain
MSVSNRVLLINDDEPLSSYLREKLIITGGYLVFVESNVHLGFENFRQNSCDAILVRFGMAVMPGAEIVKTLKHIDPDAVIIALVDDADAENSKEIITTGIYDFLALPVDVPKMFLFIRKGIELRNVLGVHRKLGQSFKEQNLSLQKQNVLLAKRIEELTRNLTRLYEDLRSTYMRTVKVLAHAIDARDHYTHSHSENVAKYAMTIAEEMRLSVDKMEKIRDACELHDLGKIGVEDSILTKPDKLTPKEWESIKCHPIIGAQILDPLTFLDTVIDLVKQHHEHYDGGGYPLGLKGEEILLGARIINLADAYEAMRSARAYRKEPLTKEQAIFEVKRNSGSQFDPKVVDAFLKVVDRLP